jgi:hypothetical protein
MCALGALALSRVEVALEILGLAEDVARFVRSCQLFLIISVARTDFLICRMFRPCYYFDYLNCITDETLQKTPPLESAIWLPQYAMLGCARVRRPMMI